MADHVRKQIRDAVVQRLGGLPSTAGRVFPGRVFPVDKMTLPCLLVYTPAEEAERETIGEAPATLRTLTVAVQVLARQGEKVQDQLDQIAGEVEGALTGRLLGGLIKESVIASTETSFSDEGEAEYGEMTLSYEMEYSVTDADVTTPL